MAFHISQDADTALTDRDITELLNRVYVEAGFASAEEAATIFEPGAVRRRGILFSAHQGNSGKPAGMVILVPPGSPARRLAQGQTAEIHLLAVHPEYRGLGLGRALMQATIDAAKALGCDGLMLWTQINMDAAQSLYASMGFSDIDEFSRNGREFKVMQTKIA